MYRKFNLKLECSQFGDRVDSLKKHGLSHLLSKKNAIISSLDSFIGENGNIDGTKMQNSWFPTIKADIFLSHSHADEDLALALAGWLNDEFGLEVFIDSCVWGYANDLLKDIDNRYCKNSSGETYNYDKRNYSTSHVHMMLSSALTQMMDKSESIIFLNTANSVSSMDVVSKTLSPWIYYEIGMTKLLRENKPERHKIRKLQEGGRIELKEEYYSNIEYELDLKELIPIDSDDLNAWKKVNGVMLGVQSLDSLYQLKQKEVSNI